MNERETETDGASDPSVGITFYWRPGCGFCARLEQVLTGVDIPLVKHNIWEDPDAAAAVRAAARGNETVPTVIIGPVALVNPSPNEVLIAMKVHCPELVPDHLNEG